MREFFETPAGKALMVLVIIVGVVLLVMSIRSTFGQSDAAAYSQNRWFVCSDTHKPFNISVTNGMTFPVRSPFSGKKTGYPAELCYWTKEGTSKSEPTYVLLNSQLGINKPTYCPDCGRLVVPRNPVPAEGVSPPPLQTTPDTSPQK